MSLIIDLTAVAIASAVVLLPGIMAGERKERERRMREAAARADAERVAKEREEMAKEARREAERMAVMETIRGVVKKAHKALERQHAAGYGPWLTALLPRGGERGRDITPGIALQAVRMTIADLAGSRFNIRCLWEAEAVLEEMKGEGE